MKLNRFCELCPDFYICIFFINALSSPRYRKNYCFQVCASTYTTNSEIPSHIFKSMGWFVSFGGVAGTRTTVQLI